MNKDMPLFQNQPYQKYSPNVFDDSLSLYEQIIAFIEFLNKVIENSNEVTTETILLRNQFEALKLFVTNNTETNQAEVLKQINDLKAYVDAFKNSVESTLLPNSISDLLTIWFENGKLANLINDEVFNMKADSETVSKLVNEFKNEQHIIGNITALVKAIKLKRVVLAFWGDSITAGADSVDINYTYVMQTIKRFKEMFPDVEFVPFNFGIGGATLQDAINANYTSPTHFQQSWGTVDGQAWRDYVKAVQPDLLFIGFGMNTVGRSREYGYFLELTQQFISGFSKIPSIALLTNYFPNVLWSGVEERNNRIHSMRATRIWGSNRNHSIICVGENYRKFVDGIDELNYIPEKYIDSQNFSVVNGVFTSNFELMNFNLTFSTTLSISTNLHVKFGKNSELRFNTNSVGWYSDGYLVDKEYLLNLSESVHQIKIERMNHLISVFVDNILYCVITGYEDFYDGKLMISKNGENLDITSVSGLSYFNVKTAKLLSVEDTLGRYEVDNFSMKLPYGGNGVNHPTTKTIEFIYNPAINDFMEGIVKKMVTTTKGIYYDLPIRISSTQFGNVNATGWGANGGLNNDNLQLKFAILKKEIDNVNMTRIKDVNGNEYNYKQYTTANINQLATTEFSIINIGGDNLLIMVTPTSNYDFFELKNMK